MTKTPNSLLSFRYYTIVFIVLFLVNCNTNEIDYPSSASTITNDIDLNDEVVYANINFSNVKVTLPVAENKNSSPDEFQSYQLKNFSYQNLEVVLPYVYENINFNRWFYKNYFKAGNCLDSTNAFLT